MPGSLTPSWLVILDMPSSAISSWASPAGLPSGSLAVSPHLSSSPAHIHGCRNLSHYLDNYFLVDATHSRCACSLNTFRLLCLDPQDPLAHRKIVLPNQQLVYLGITILATVLLEICLPLEKIAGCGCACPSARSGIIAPNGSWFPSSASFLLPVRSSTQAGACYVGSLTCPQRCLRCHT